MHYDTVCMEDWSWAKTPRHKRRPKRRFTAGWQNTLNLLEAELRHLQATDIIMQLRLQPHEIRLDGRPRSTAVPASPEVALEFDCKHGHLVYRCDSCQFWQHNVRSIALTLQALRAVDRYGMSTTGEQYRGWTGIENEGDKQEVDLDDPHGAARVLGMLGGYHPEVLLNDKELVNSLVRRLMRENHPDQGHDAPVTFRTVSAIKSTLEKWFNR